MQPRLKYSEIVPEASRHLDKTWAYITHSGLEASLIDLVCLRASQINGCGYCIDMHTKDARARGESEQRLYGLSVWRETPYYTDRERAALAWTEAVTRVSESRVPDEVYEQARQHFTEEELVKLNLTVVIINAYNRFAIAFRTVPGTYEPDSPVAAMTAQA
jgi:AhpD family alkylhydroperoxidase